MRKDEKLMHMTHIGRSMTATAALVICVSAWAGAAGLVPGVVVTEDGSAVIAMAPTGGVVALEVGTGEVRWTAIAGDRPLIVSDAVVVAQVERFENGQLTIGFLNLGDGTLLGRADLEIDPIARARVGEGLGERFDIASVPATGTQYLTWEYTARQVQGIAPSDNALAARTTDGAVSVDLTAMSAIPIDRGSVPMTEAPQPPDGFLQSLSGDRLAIEPVFVGEVWAALTIRPGPRGASVLKLRRWDAVNDVPLVDLTLWTGHMVHAWSSAGNQTVVVSAATHPGEWQEYTWSLFELGSGANAGEIRSPVARAPIVMLAGGSMLTVRPPVGRRVGTDWSETPRQLVVLDPETGAETWTRPLRDLAFRGPFPP